MACSLVVPALTTLPAARSTVVDGDLPRWRRQSKAEASPTRHAGRNRMRQRETSFPPAPAVTPSTI
ncbi:hypothetical protein FHR80_000229 [Cellulomonas cellasea]|uniref:Uncharacterized protein n=1 Tax=Cellulomonas cellasea TaxID=43670 RepID=A0A7W4UCW0_9CELL|nr:hypothetical protein [Cellulomonas cellasea]